MRRVASHMYERILVPTDGSTGSEQVADHAAELAATTGADLYGIYVVDEKDVGVGSDELSQEEVERAFEDTGLAALGEVSEAGEHRDVATETEIRQGVPHRSIVDYAEEIGADVIVMGTHGRSGLERYLLGSVTEHVMRSARQPVLAVKLSGTAVTSAEAAVEAAARALEAEGEDLGEDRHLEELREEPWRERTTWVVPALTTDGRRVNVHVDAVTGDTRVAHLVD